MRVQGFIAAFGLLVGSAVGAQEAARLEVTQSMVDAASALLGTVAGGPGGTERLLGFDRGKNLALTLDDEARENWAYWPTERVGVPLELMTAEQRRLAQQLLTSLLSSRGYFKVVHIMQLEPILGMLDGVGLPRSVGHYKLVLFGTPSMTTPWGWRFEGHHVSLNVVVSGQSVAVTPSFFGSNPGEIRSGPLTGFRVLGTEEDLARDLVTSFTARQRTQGVLSNQAPTDIFSGNLGKARDQWDAWRQTLAPQGLRVADLNEVQQHWVRRILEEVVGAYRPELSTDYLRSIDPATLSFAWMGGMERGEPHYFRLQGADFVFEYDNVQDGGNHVHSVWRSKSQDFGARLLEEHYRTSHVRPE